MELENKKIGASSNTVKCIPYTNWLAYSALATRAMGRAHNFCNPFTA
jgi:hypothetical protein